MIRPMKISQATHAVLLPETPPEWIHLLPAGEFAGRDGRGPYTADAPTILQEFAAWGMPVAGDYEHQSLTAEQKSGPVPGSGWINDLEVRDDGVWGQVEWTETAAEAIAKKEYRYLSPVFDYVKDENRVVRITGFGLTNQPNLYLSAIHRHAIELAGQLYPPMEDHIMLLEDVRWWLNLPKTATEAEVSADLDKLKTMLGDTGQAAMTALGLGEDARLPDLITAVQGYAPPDPVIETVTHTIEPDMAKFVPREQYDQVAQSLTQYQTQEREAMVNALVSEGKLAPAQKDWATAYASRDPEGFADFAKAAPVIVSESHSDHPLPSDADEEHRLAMRIAGVQETE